MASTPITLSQSGAATGQVITWNGTSWVPASPATSAMMAKGDLLTFNSAISRLPVGTDQQVLIADSTQPAGLRWGTLPALAGITMNGVVFGSGNGAVAQSSAFVFNASTGQLEVDGGVGINTAPGVAGTVNVGGIAAPNLGLISTVPGANLFLANQSGVFAVENNVSSQVFTVDQSGNTATQGNLAVYTGSTQRFKVDQSGIVTAAGCLNVNSGGLNSYIDGFLGVNGIHSPVFELHVQGANMLIDRFASDAAGHGAQIVGRRAYGAPGAPAAALTSGTVGAIFAGYIYDGSVYQEIGEIRMQMDGNGLGGTSPSIPSCMVFRVSPQGSNGGIERMRLDNQGRLMLGTTTANGVLTLNGDLTPDVAGYHSLGTPACPFNALNLSGNAAIGGGLSASGAVASGAAVTGLSLGASDFVNPTISLTASSSNGSIRNWAIVTNKSANGNFEIQCGASQGAAPSITALLLTNTGAVQANRSLYVNDAAYPEVRIMNNGTNAWGFFDGLDGSAIMSLYDYRKQITRMTVTGTGTGIGPGNIAPACTLDVSDQTASTGATRLRVRAGAADGSAAKVLQLTLADGRTEKFSITRDGILSFGGGNTTGSGSAALGANCPAANATTPYTWLQITTADGSNAYVPCWK